MGKFEEKDLISNLQVIVISLGNIKISSHRRNNIEVCHEDPIN